MGFENNSEMAKFSNGQSDRTVGNENNNNNNNIDDRNRKFTYQQIRREIDEKKRKLLIYQCQVYDITKWIDKHPGGDLVISHMVGRDATDQILTNHSKEILDKYMKMFVVGNVDMDDATTRQYVDRPLSMEFRKLHARMVREKLLETHWSYYFVVYSSIFLWFALAFASLWFHGDTLLGCAISGILIAIFWHQSAGIMHDTGHNAISQNRHVDTWVGIVFSNMFTGISIGWWKTSHFVHHLVTNDPEHDPHIQMLPFIAISTRFFESLYSTYHKRILPFDRFAQFMVQFQHLVYIPLMSLARYVMYKDTFVYLQRKERGWKSETFAIACYWCYFFSMIFFLIPDNRLRIFYFFWPNLIMVILLLQLYVSHNHMSTESMGEQEEYLPYQLRTTIDFWCPKGFDFLHCGLQFQIAHHLFPRMPRHNLRPATEIIKKFCQKHNLTYTHMGFIEGNVKLLKHMREIAFEAEKYSNKQC